MFTETVEINLIEILSLSFNLFDMSSTQMVFRIVIKETCYTSSSNSYMPF